MLRTTDTYLIHEATMGIANPECAAELAHTLAARITLEPTGDQSDPLCLTYNGSVVPRSQALRPVRLGIYDTLTMEGIEGHTVVEVGCLPWKPRGTNVDGLYVVQQPLLAMQAQLPGFHADKKGTAVVVPNPSGMPLSTVYGAGLDHFNFYRNNSGLAGLPVRYVESDDRGGAATTGVLRVVTLAFNDDRGGRVVGETLRSAFDSVVPHWWVDAVGAVSGSNALVVEEASCTDREHGPEGRPVRVLAALGTLALAAEEALRNPTGGIN